MTAITPKRPVGRPKITAVTEAELAVMRLLASGLTGAQAAAKLNIEQSSACKRLRRAGDKLGTTTTLQTILECYRRGLLGDGGDS